MSEKWTPRQLEYIGWCATPRDLREPRSREELAKQFKCAARTLHRWQNLPGFWDEVDRLIKKWVGERTPDILDAMVGKAMLGGKEKNGDVPAARLVLGYAGKYAEKAGGDASMAIKVDVNLGHLSNEDIEELIKKTGS